MRKFLRSTKDGYVYGFNEILAKWPEMESFETDQAPPERIPDLTEYLAGEKKAAKVKVKPAKPEGDGE